MEPKDRIEALHEADQLWELGELTDNYQRLQTVKAINFLKVFSLKNLAIIARLKPSDLTDAGIEEYVSYAGTLNPESIKTLRLFYANYYSYEKISKPLLDIIRRDGTSLKVVAQITGIPLDKLEGK